MRHLKKIVKPMEVILRSKTCDVEISENQTTYFIILEAIKMEYNALLQDLQQALHNLLQKSSFHRFHEFSLDVSSLIVTTSTFVKNDETSRNIREANGGQIKEQDVPLVSRCLIFDLSFLTNADVITIKDETSKENSRNRCKANYLRRKIYLRCPHSYAWKHFYLLVF